MTVVKHETGSALTIQDGQEFWSEHQLAALVQLGVKDAPNGDLAVYFHQCQRTGLDPFARQIYMIGRYDGQTRGTKYTIQTGIDGFRLVGRRAADATHHTISISETEWCGPDGVWRDVWLSTDPPAAARITLYRDGGAFPAIALWSEYAQTKADGSLTRMWKDRAAGQLAKCAEALAWRKAFPQDLSGLYTSDEMARANGDVSGQVEVESSPRISQATSLDDALAVGVEADIADAEIVEAVRADQLDRLSALMAAAGLTKSDMLDEARRIAGRDLANAKAMTADEADRLAEYLSNVVAPVDFDGPNIGSAAS
jgi:phage recombination protein Bet